MCIGLNSLCSRHFTRGATIDVGNHVYGEVAGIQLVHSNIFHIYIGIKDPKTGIAIMTFPY